MEKNGLKVGIIGGGFTALTAARELLKKGYQVSVFESQNSWGGLASAFEITPGVFIERFYHHLFTNDGDIISLCRELGLESKLRVLSGKTAQLYQSKTYPFDSPLSVLRFAPLNFFDRLRFGLITFYLKLKSDGFAFEKFRAAAWIRKYYGEAAYRIVWQPLLRGKFSHYFEEISLTWFWARVYKRTRKLIYPEGGFETIIKALVSSLKSSGADLFLNQRIEKVDYRDGLWRVSASGQEREFNKLITTTSIKSFIKIFPELPSDYRSSTDSINYINAQVLILVLKKSLTPFYWLNVADSDYPFLVLAEQTNLTGRQVYDGRIPVYLGNYLPDGDERLKMNEDELLALYEPYLKKINPEFNRDWVEKAVRFVAPFAQPIVGIDYREKIPPFLVPGYKDLYLATMAQVYPWDRGTNYAVKLGKDLVEKYF
ncbi:MAG: NAD(P)/FAD-dependent oxidoreductase [Patescibacteria group bacterium]|nr:NAD(P)/FAD-dependent oxidoreductase [Patescibacteria group bacterium]